MITGLQPVTDDDRRELMSWFNTASDVEIWSGPKFRFPFSDETFRVDSHWDRLPSYRLQLDDTVFAAFGQISERYDRVHFARLVVRPSLRGRGLGVRLVEELLRKGRDDYAHEEFGLFVLRDNLPALNCYRRAGFSIVDYPAGAPMPERCHYLTMRR